jgi:hypothetical protein
MSRLSRSSRLLQNAEAALISSIEVYNKPSFAYREETFAILALNAWELLLKAKLLSANGNDPRCLNVYYFPKTKSGKPSKKPQVKRNRSNNILTIGIEHCIVELEKKGFPVPAPVQRNLEALTEIRDNAVHFVNANPQLAKQVLEIGTASLRNFIELGKVWLGLDMSDYCLFLMPIGFLPPTSSITGITLSPDEKNVVNYLAGLMRDSEDDPIQNFHVSLDVNISFKRTSTADATAVIISNSPDAVPVTLQEEDVRKRFPWDYKELTERLKKRYIDFVENMKYHNLRKKLAAEPQFRKTRYLDPGNPKSMYKDFYSPNILFEFDKAYTLRV